MNKKYFICSNYKLLLQLFSKFFIDNFGQHYLRIGESKSEEKRIKTNKFLNLYIEVRNRNIPLTLNKSMPEPFFNLKYKVVILTFECERTEHYYYYYLSLHLYNSEHFYICRFLPAYSTLYFIVK